MLEVHTAGTAVLWSRNQGKRRVEKVKQKSKKMNLTIYLMYTSQERLTRNGSTFSVIRSSQKWCYSPK